MISSAQITKNTFLTVALVLASIFIAAIFPTFVSAQAGHSHANTCGTYGTVTGFTPTGRITGGTQTLRWDAVKNIGGGAIGQPVTGRVWYHLDIQNLSTGAVQSIETPVYDKTPITTTNYTFASNTDYKIAIYGRGGCGYGPIANYTVTTKPLLPPINLSASCPQPGTTATLKWTAATDAVQYALRINDLANGWECDGSPLAGDFCSNVTGTSYTYRTTAGHSYSWWIHSIDRYGNISNPSSGTFSCPAAVAPTPTPAFVPRVTHTPAPTTVPPTPTGAVVSCPIVPIDIEIMLDRSSSMWDPNRAGVVSGQTKLSLAKAAAKTFVDEFMKTSVAKNNGVRIGVGSFASSATAPTPLTLTTSNYQTILSQINTISTGSSGTCIDCALYAANNKLKSIGLNNSNSRTKKIVILLSDGRANKYRDDATGSTKDDGTSDKRTAGHEAIKEAKKGRGGGYSYRIAYYVNGYGSSESPVRTWVLAGPPYDTTLGTLGIANGNSSSVYYKYSSDPFYWDNILDGFQNNICSNGLFLASSAQAVAGAKTGKILIDRATLMEKISAFVDSLMQEYEVK